MYHDSSANPNSVSTQPATSDHQSDASDQRTPGGILTPSLATLVASEPPATLRELLAHDQRSIPVETTARCLRPGCESDVSFPGDGKTTRPAAFCSVQCRGQFEHRRLQLLSELEALETHRELPGSSREKRAVNRAVSLRRWMLQRYPAWR